MVFCCFGGKTSADDPQHGASIPPKTTAIVRSTAEIPEDVACAVSNTRQAHHSVNDTVSTLRCQLAMVQGSWLARVHACVENLLSACGPAAVQVSLFGASPCGSMFVALDSASAFAPAGLLSPGLVLSTPWPGYGCPAGGGTPSVTANAVPSSTSGGLVILGSPRACGSMEPDILFWQESTTPTTDPRARPQAAERPIPLQKARSSSQHMDAAMLPPEDWRQVLRAIGSDLAGTPAATGTAGNVPSPPTADKAAAAAAATPAPQVRAQLIPLRLGADVVGALLLTAPPVMTPPVTARGAAAAAASFRRPDAALPREMLTCIAAAVVECCLGPHLADIQRVALAAAEVAAAPDLQGLASSLSTALTESLASELHVDFTVRLALVPYTTGVRGNPQFGFLLTEQQLTAAVMGIPPGAGAALAQTAAASVELSSRPSTPAMHRPVSRNATRSLTHQSFAERLLTAKLSANLPTGASILLDPIGGGGSSGGGSHTHTLAAAGAGAGLPPPPALSGVHSFQLPGGAAHKCGPGLARVWKARPFALESTLLASLFRKASKAGGGMVTPPYGMTALTGPATASTVVGGGGGIGMSVPSVYVALGALSHSTLEDNGSSSNAPSPTPRVGGGGGVMGGYASYMTVGSFLTGLSLGSANGGGGAGRLRVRRMGGMVVPHVHAYVNDTDQPSGDVVLLLRTAAAGFGALAGGRGTPGGGGGGGGGLGLLTGGAASSGGAGPASLVLVIGSVSLLTADMNRGGAAGAGGAPATADTSVGCGPERPSGRSGLGSAVLSACSAARRNSVGGVGVGGGGTAAGGSGGLDVCVALYLTSHERLPASLLCAARNRVQVLLELLLPAAGACLSDAASAELQYLCDAVSCSGAVGAATAAASSALAGRAASVPIGRLQPRPADDVTSGLPSPTQPHGLGSAANGAVEATVDAATGLLALPLGASGSGACGPTSGLDSGTANVVSASLSLRVCGVGEGAGHPSMARPGGTAASASAAVAAAGAGVEGVEPDGNTLTQLLMTRGTVLMSAPENATNLLGTATTTNANGWTPLTTGGGGGGGGQVARDASEAAPRVPRSRLSNATATGVTGTGTVNTPGGGGTGHTAAVANALMTSYNSLLSALMGSGSITGKGFGAGGGGGGIGGNDAAGTITDTGYGSMSSMPGASASAAQLAATAAAAAAAAASTGLPQHSAQSLQRRTMLLLQQHQHQQQHQQHLMHMMQRASPASASSGRTLAAGRLHAPPRRQVSDLLATMPWDVSDTVTVMRTNMDILVSSFWNTLRSTNVEAAPSPYADEDLRFLRLFKVIGGGGCATVYAGLLHGLEVAVKVMKAPVPEGDDVEEAEAEEADRVRRKRQQGQQQSPQRQGQGRGRGQECQEGQEGQDGNDDSTTLEPLSSRQAQMRAIMRGARELAVMTSISHPNIVQIYSYHTRVLVRSETEEAQGGGGASGRPGGVVAAPSPLAGGQLPRLIPVAEGSLNSAPGPLQTVLIMECCDLGSLADALDSGMFAQAIRNAESIRWRPGPRRSQTASLLGTIPADSSVTYGSSGSAFGSNGARSSNAAGGNAMRAVYLTLLEVALALRHMHAMQLVHCDVKPANVLLKSSASDPRGFTCKLTDFGFVNLLQYHVEDADDPQAKPSMRYHEPVGTVTHLAPETMVQGSKLDHTVDIFAFGILMWEVYTGKAPYAEHATNNFRDVPYRVVREGMRPTFPGSTPLAFRSLAQACWSADASKRPSAAGLVASLQRLMDAAARG